MGEKNWEKRGSLPEGALPNAVAVSPEGYGLVASRTEPSSGTPVEQLRARRAQLTRVTAAGAQQVYEGAGWIQALDGSGPHWFAVVANLRATGEGSEYRLLRSTDGGKSWQLRGPIIASSVAQVLAVGQNEAWVLGTAYLGYTVDAGASWVPVSAEGPRDPHRERLRRAGDGVALLGERGLAVTTNLGNSWRPAPVDGATVHDVEGDYLVVTRGDKAGVGVREGAQIRWLTGLPEHRHPMRLAVAGPILRVLTRAADPAKEGGLDLTVYRSEDGGKGWMAVRLGHGFRIEADIAGDCGLGLELLGTLRAAL